MVEVIVQGVALDIINNAPIVLLTAKNSTSLDEQKILPIWVGHSEAASIDRAMTKKAPPRPQTHDFFKVVMENLQARVAKVEITELKDQTYYARLYLQQGDKIWELDARPSDSIALALRFDAPIYANKKLLDELGKETESSGGPSQNDLRETLKNMKPEEFGKFDC